MRRIEDLTEPELAQVMQASAKLLEAAWAKMGMERPLFALLVFNDPAAGQYIANCQRQDVIKVMRLTADRLEKKQTIERTRFPEPENN